MKRLSIFVLGVVMTTSLFALPLKETHIAAQVQRTALAERQAQPSPAILEQLPQAEQLALDKQLRAEA